MDPENIMAHFKTKIQDFEAMDSDTPGIFSTFKTICKIFIAWFIFLFKLFIEAFTLQYEWWSNDFREFDTSIHYTIRLGAFCTVRSCRQTPGRQLMRSTGRLYASGLTRMEVQKRRKCCSRRGPIFYSLCGSSCKITQRLLKNTLWLRLQSMGEPLGRATPSSGLT